MSKAPGIGYLKLWRSIKDWHWYSDVPVRTLFLHLLVEANYEAKQWKGVDLIPGQFITSTVQLADEMATSRASIHRALKKLESSGEVNVQTNNHWTLVTIANWDKWQGKDETSERPLRHRRTSSERPAGTTKEVKKERREEEVESARAEFKIKCKAITEGDNEILDKSLRQGFFDYWTEPNAAKVMRFEEEKYFDHARRMRNWQKKAIERGDLKPHGDKHNPRA